MNRKYYIPTEDAIIKRSLCKIVNVAIGMHNMSFHLLSLMIIFDKPRFSIIPFAARPCIDVLPIHLKVQRIHSMDLQVPYQYSQTYIP